MLATCGNDSLVKLYRMRIVDDLTAKMSLIYSLVGHGGDVTCVRFSPFTERIVASTATDKTARIWDTVHRCFFLIIQAGIFLWTSSIFLD